MDILKHGSLERCYEYDKEHGIILYFRCPRCMCEFSASSARNEIIPSSSEQGKSAICPECKFQTFECYDSAHMLNMTLYEKLHTASKEELAEFLALSYGMYASQNNELFNNNSIPGFVAYFGFGMYDAIKNHILEELNKELEDLEFVKNFKNELEIADCEKQQATEKAKKTEADKKRREAAKKKGC